MHCSAHKIAIELQIIEMDPTILVELNCDRGMSSQPCKLLNREEYVKRDLISLWGGFRLWHQFSDLPASVNSHMYVMCMCLSMFEYTSRTLCTIEREIMLIASMKNA